MSIIKHSHIVDYTQAQMYDLVNSIEDYPEFLPWCKESSILSQDEDEIQARLTIAGGGFHKSFTTCNRLQKDKMIEIRLVNGPFKHLEGFWRFDTVDNGQSKISLDMEFEFAGKFLDFAFGPIFHQVSSTLVDAFSQRAIEIYGKN